MIDRHSATWAAVKRACEEHLTLARSELEVPGADHGTSEQLRGRILAFNTILGLALKGQAGKD